MSVAFYPGLADDARRRLEQYRAEARLTILVNLRFGLPLSRWQNLAAMLGEPIRPERASLRNMPTAKSSEVNR